MAPRKRSPTSRLSPRDRQILDHIVRYRLTTHEVLHKLVFPQKQPSAVAKVCARLCRAGLLNRFPLSHPRTYLRLSEQSTRDRGLPRHRAEPLGPQSLPTEYAVLAYATLGERIHQRFTAAEVRQLCPWLEPALAEAPHCGDKTADASVLELLRVDLGGRPDHVARKCAADIRVRRRSSEFDRMLQEKRFRLVVITATSSKAAAIKAALNQHVWPDGLRIHLAVVSDLLPLTARIQHGS